MPKPLVTILFALVLAASSPAAAQTVDPELKELAAYTLTVDTLNRIDRANKAMLVNIQNDPKYGERIKLGKELDALKKKEETTEADDKRIEELEARIEKIDAANDDGTEAKTIADMERKIAAMPPFANALKTAGLTPREYAKFTMAMVLAGFAVAGQELSAKKGINVPMPDGVNAANVKFVQEHAAEIQRLQESYEKLSVIK
jgi:hypothetical protein